MFFLNIAYSYTNIYKDLLHIFYRGGLLFLELSAVEEDASPSGPFPPDAATMDLGVALLFPFAAFAVLFTVLRGLLVAAAAAANAAVALVTFAVDPLALPPPISTTGCESSGGGFCKWVALLFPVTCRPNFRRLLSETAGSSSS